MITNKKSLSLQIVLCMGLLTGSTQPVLSPKAITDCYEGRDSSFKYLEFIFVEQPKNAIAAANQKAQAISLGVVTAAIVLLNNLMSAPETDADTKIKEAMKNYLTIGDKGLVTFPSSPKEFIKFNTSTVASGIFGLVLYDVYRNYVEQSIKHDTLVKFLKNWEFHSQYIPTQLVPAFDELAQAFEASRSKTLTKEQVSEIFAVIQHLLEHEFSKRYDNKSKASVDTLSTLKTITDISKNLK